MYKTLITATALLSSLDFAQAKPARLSRRNIISALPESASDTELKFQPYLDFDTDGCYNTAAVDPNGNTNEGHDATGTLEGDCRDPHQLENSNAYVRGRCNNGYCAYIYEYYFEKDQGQVGKGAFGIAWGGHKHEWENIIVMTNYNDVLYVTPSAHGHNKDDIEGLPPMDGTHPQLVYHREGQGTHNFRFANQDDVNGPENYSGQFYRSPLVSYNRFPSNDIRQALIDKWPGGVCPKWEDAYFGDTLWNALHKKFPDFDPFTDA